jgi:hypothetical protein
VNRFEKSTAAQQYGLRGPSQILASRQRRVLQPQARVHRPLGPPAIFVALGDIRRAYRPQVRDFSM